MRRSLYGGAGRHLRQGNSGAPPEPKRPEGVVQSEDGVMWQEGAWGLEWWDMRLGSQAVATMREA